MMMMITLTVPKCCFVIRLRTYELRTLEISGTFTVHFLLRRFMSFMSVVNMLVM